MAHARQGRLDDKLDDMGIVNFALFAGIVDAGRKSPAQLVDDPLYKSALAKVARKGNVDPSLELVAVRMVTEVKMSELTKERSSKEIKMLANRAERASVDKGFSGAGKAGAARGAE